MRHPWEIHRKENGWGSLLQRMVSHAKMKIACGFQRGKDHESAKVVWRGHPVEQSSRYGGQRTELGTERQEHQGREQRGQMLWEGCPGQILRARA